MYSPLLKMTSQAGYIPGRSGSYEPTPEGYRAFRPKLLPPDPPLEYSSELIGILSEAAVQLGRLDGAAEILPDPDFFVYSYVRKEAVLSSQIEGTRSSLTDLFEFEAGASGARLPRDVREVANYVHAMNNARDTVSKGDAVSIELLKKAHATLLHRVRGAEAEPGKIRTRQNWIGPIGSSPATADFIPPPPTDVPGELALLESYINTPTPESPLIKAGLVHAQFETIHPFLDGNGRLGRLLITLMLTKYGALRRPVLYLSHYFLKKRDDYNRSLQRVRDDGAWESWLMFFLEGVRQASLQAAETAREILELRERHVQLLEKALAGRAGTAQRLLEMLFRTPVVSVTAISSKLGVSFPTANKLVAQFEKLDLLEEVTGQARNRFFRYKPYIEVLRRDEIRAVPTFMTLTVRSAGESPGDRPATAGGG